jgi:hypothetical protein
MPLNRPVEERYTRVQLRMANLTTVLRVRGEDAERVLNNGSWDERRELALSRLEDAVAELEKLVSPTK